MTVSETISDNPTAAAMANAMSRKSCPAESWINRMGVNTTIVVSVDASTAPPTSSVPSMQACRTLFFISRWRKMFSMTTIALSTTMPTANAIPASDTMFTVRPSRTSTTIATTTEIGIASAMMPTVRNERRKSSRTIVASRPPKTMLLRTSAIASLTYSVES